MYEPDSSPWPAPTIATPSPFRSLFRLLPGGRCASLVARRAAGRNDRSTASLRRSVAPPTLSPTQATKCIEATPPSYESAIVLWAALLAPDLESQRELLFAVIGDGGRRFLELTEVGFASFDTTDWPALFLDRHRVANEWQQFFGDVDVLLTPTWTTPPFEHGADIALP